MRPVRTAWSFVVSAVALCGCTALLGTFDVSTAGPGGDDGGPDTASDVALTDVSPPDDAGDASDAKPPPPPGTVLLAKSFGGTNQDAVLASAVDAMGNIILAGPFYSPDLDFGCAVHAKLDAVRFRRSEPRQLRRQARLDRRMQVARSDDRHGRRHDHRRCCRAHGQRLHQRTTSSPNPTLGTTVIPTTANVYQGFLARLDAATGKVDYVRRFGGPAGAYGGDVSVSGSGLVVLGGPGEGHVRREHLPAGIDWRADDSLAEHRPPVRHRRRLQLRWRATVGRIIKAFNNDSDVSVYKILGDAKDDILAAGVFNSAGGIDPIGFPGSGGGVQPKNAVGAPRSSS